MYDPPEAFVEALIASVAAQTYPHWQLCLANAGASPAVKARLDAWAAREPRVQVAHLGENRGIAGNTNAAIALAQGDYVAFADHDDTLAPFALFEMAKAVNDDPAADFLYSRRGQARHRRRPLRTLLQARLVPGDAAQPQTTSATSPC